MINVCIDELTPCLKDSRTGDIVQTEVVRIRRKSFLRKYNARNGWYVNWDELLDECEIYALVVEGSVDIQGLVAVEPNPEMSALYIAWMCSSPENNRLIADEVRYSGVGGYLFAIAAQRSFDMGFDGFLYGFAANQVLLEHYVERFDAEFIGVLHPFQFAIDGDQANLIREVYDCEWTDEEI